MEDESLANINAHDAMRELTVILITFPGFHRERNLMKQPIFTPGKGITSIF